MIQKKPVYPELIRKVPKQFSWIDHRLVQEGRIDQCSHAGAALYLFLVTVADARGLSYYSDASICKRLHMEQDVLNKVRRELCRVSLIAYQSPIYQVLPLEETMPHRTNRPPSVPMSFKQIIKQMAERAS